MQQWLHDMYFESRVLLSQGGLVLWIILAISVVLYSMLLATWMVLSPLRDEIRSTHFSKYADDKRTLVREYAIFDLDRMAWVDRRMPVLGVMVGVCTLGGLLGTVSGMLVTFSSMASQQNADPMQKISVGISEALVTTQAGLLVALPASFIYALLLVRVRQVHGELDRHLHKDLRKLYQEGNA